MVPGRNNSFIVGRHDEMDVVWHLDLVQTLALNADGAPSDPLLQDGFMALVSEVKRLFRDNVHARAKMRVKLPRKLLDIRYSVAMRLKESTEVICINRFTGSALAQKNRNNHRRSARGLDNSNHPLDEIVIVPLIRCADVLEHVIEVSLMMISGNRL